jgi:hypothetical protein
MMKSERRERRKKQRKFQVHGRRFAEIVRNAVLKRSREQGKK